ncbi:MAG: FAD:protein FMN transferase [Verrucomicrobiota bacterium]
MINNFANVLIGFSNRIKLSSAAGFLLLCSCARMAVTDGLEARYEFNEPQMGVPFRIVLYAATKSQAERASSAAFARVRELNDILSDYDAESELSKLSRTSGSGQKIKVSDDLWFILQRSQKLSEMSGGGFDITVGPVVNLWRKARREKKMPDANRLAEARRAVGYKNLQLDSKTRTAELLVPNMRLDLGSIAKGFAVDEALKVLRQHRIASALVAGAGDLAVSDSPPGKKGWRIEIAPLDAPDAPEKKFVLLKNAALGTSGDLFQRLEIEGKRYSHIVDPHTGIGLTDHSLVNAIAQDCITANTLATTASVLGPEKALQLAQKIPRAVIRISRKPDETIEEVESSGFKKFYE